MKKIYSTIVFAFAVQLVSAQWSNDSTQNTVVKDNAGVDEVTPLQATAPNGYTYVSWFETDGANYDARMQLFDVQGNKLWGDDGLLVSNHPTGSALYIYNLGVDNDGNAILAFQDERTGNLQPVVYKLDQSGNFIWGNDGIVLHDTSATFEVAPAIGVLENNDVIIAWNASATKKWIAFQKITADGNLGWSANKNIKSNSKNYSRAEFVNLDDETFMMSYVQETGSFPSVTSIIYADHYDSSGNALWTTPTKSSTYSTSFFEWPVVAGDGKKGILIAFNGGEPGNPSINDAFIQRIDSNGNNLFGTNGTEIAVFANNHRLVSGISYLSNSDQIGVSLQVLDNSQNQSGIYAQKIDSSGNRLWGDTGYELLSLSSSDYRTPFGIARADDGWMVAYTDGGVITQNFKVIKFDLNGNAIWNKMISAVSSNKYDATMGAFMNDQEVVVWYDQRSGGGVYAQNITGEGNLGVVATSLENAQQSFVTVFPALAHDILFISGNEKLSAAEFRIFDVTGIEKLNPTLNAGINELNISALPSGIYFYSIQEKGKIQSGKFCKQ